MFSNSRQFRVQDRLFKIKTKSLKIWKKDLMRWTKDIEEGDESLDTDLQLVPYFKQIKQRSHLL